MRSGFCSLLSCSKNQRGATHDRCRMESCSCTWHDEDVKVKAAALTDETPLVVMTKDPDATTALVAAAMKMGRGGEPPASDLLEAIMAVSIAAEHLTRAATDLPDAEQSLRLLHLLRKAIDHARDVDAALVQHIYLAGEHGDVRVEGLPPAKVQRARDRKNWDERGAVFAYLERRLDEHTFEHDGEYPDPSTVASWVLEVVGVSYCRVTPLRDRGLDPADFCDETPGRISVQFAD